MITTNSAVEAILRRREVIQDGHFVYASGLHGRKYFQKDAVYPFVDDISALCRRMVEPFANSGVEVIVGPEKGGIILATWGAHHLSMLTGRAVLALYAEREEKSVVKPGKTVDATVWLPGDDERTAHLEKDDELLVRRKTFKIGRGYDVHVKRKKVLVMEDVLTTGASARAAADAARRAEGDVMGCTALCNRGEVTAEMVNVPRLEALYTVRMDTWTEELCPINGPCAEGVPINTNAGKGAAYLARKAGKR